jgi:hypothetical protein
MQRLRILRMLAVGCCAAALGAAVPFLVAGVADEVQANGKGPRPDTPAAAPVSSRHPLAGDFTVDETSLSTCEQVAAGGDDARRQRCREQALGNVAYARGADAGFAELERLIASADATWRIDSHGIAHMIGSATLVRNEGALGATFASGSMVGSAGYYHGVILRVLGDVPAEQHAAALARACADRAVARVPFLRYQCHHGAGHGLMIYSGYDLPGALATCDSLKTNQHQFDCKTGVFMENYAEFLGAGVPGFRSPWINEDPLYPCNDVAARHAEACYVQVVDRIGPEMNWDWARIADVCRTIGEPKNVANCFDSFGLWVNHWARSSAPKILADCALAGGDAGECTYGAVRALINNNTTDRATQDRAAALCNAAPPSDRERCFRGLGTVMQQLGRREHATACTRIAGSWRATCMRGFGRAIAHAPRQAS